MSQSPTTELTLVEALNRVTSAEPSPEPDTATAKAAFRRCCAAWQRAYKAYMDDEDGDPSSAVDMHFASEQAARAYCNVMPMLAGNDGIRDFIACAAHGIAIGAIPAEKGGQLLYAAQVALNVSHPSARRAKPPLVVKTRSR